MLYVDFAVALFSWCMLFSRAKYTEILFFSYSFQISENGNVCACFGGGVDGLSAFINLIKKWIRLFLKYCYKLQMKEIACATDTQLTCNKHTTYFRDVKYITKRTFRDVFHNMWCCEIHHICCDIFHLLFDGRRFPLATSQFDDKIR